MKTPYSQMLLREPLKINGLDIFLNGTQVMNNPVQAQQVGLARGYSHLTPTGVADLLSFAVK